jgi:hypothetical protein
MGKKALPKARAKAKGRPRALAPVSQKYGYLPPDLQRAGQHMERVAFLRKLQKSIADQNYIRTHGGDSGLSEHGAVGLGEKVAMVASTIAKPKVLANPKMVPKPPPPARSASWSEFGRGRSRSPRAAAGSSTQPMVYDL